MFSCAHSSMFRILRLVFCWFSGSTRSRGTHRPSGLPRMQRHKGEHFSDVFLHKSQPFFFFFFVCVWGGGGGGAGVVVVIFCFHCPGQCHTPHSNCAYHAFSFISGYIMALKSVPLFCLLSLSSAGSCCFFCLVLSLLMAYSSDPPPPPLLPLEICAVSFDKR